MNPEIKFDGKAKYGVFIIESLSEGDERAQNLDGKILGQMLRLSIIESIYSYVTTKKDFIEQIDAFNKSNLAFLHLSCHGNSKEIGLKSGERISFEELGIIMGEALRYKRLFLSICNASQFELAKYFIPKHHCFSIIGTPDQIQFDKAALFWSSFYYLMYTKDVYQMIQKDIIINLKKLTSLFNLRISYYSIIKDAFEGSQNHLAERIILEGELISEKALKTEFSNLYRKLA